MFQSQYILRALVATCNVLSASGVFSQASQVAAACRALGVGTGLAACGAIMSRTARSAPPAAAPDKNYDASDELVDDVVQTRSAAQDLAKISRSAPSELVNVPGPRPGPNIVRSLPMRPLAGFGRTSHHMSPPPYTTTSRFAAARLPVPLPVRRMVGRSWPKAFVDGPEPPRFWNPKVEPNFDQLTTQLPPLGAPLRSPLHAAGGVLLREMQQHLLHDKFSPRRGQQEGTIAHHTLFLGEQSREHGGFSLCGNTMLPADVRLRRCAEQLFRQEQEKSLLGVRINIDLGGARPMDEPCGLDERPTGDVQHDEKSCSPCFPRTIGTSKKIPLPRRGVQHPRRWLLRAAAIGACALVGGYGASTFWGSGRGLGGSAIGTDANFSCVPNSSAGGHVEGKSGVSPDRWARGG